MSNKVTVQLPQPEGVAAGATATLRVPVGRRIHLIALVLGANLAVAELEEIRIFVNGQVIQKFTGQERDELNQFDGLPAANDSILMLPFDRNKMLTLAGREMTALNTGVADASGRKIETVYVEVDIAAGAVGVTPSDLTAFSKESDAIKFSADGKPYGAGVIPYIRREQRSSADADSDFQISDLVNAGVNAPDKMALVRTSFIPSAGVISKMTVERNNFKVIDRSDALNRALQEAGERFPQAGVYTIDTGENGHSGEVIDLIGITDFRYRLNVSTATTLTCLSEYYGGLTG